MSELFHFNIDLGGNELQNAVMQPLTANPGTAQLLKLWGRSNVASGAGGNGAIFYFDSAGNPVQLATGSSALSNAFSIVTDGTTPATATGGGTFKIRTANTAHLSIVTQNDDATHGDNALFTINVATAGGNDKVLATDSSGNSAVDRLKLLSAPSASKQIGMSAGNNLQWHNGTAVKNATSEENVATISGLWTFTNSLVLNVAGSIGAGYLGYNSGTGALTWGNGTVIREALSKVGTETFSNKTLGSDLDGGAFKITNLADGTAASHAATVGQLQAATLGSAWKDSVRAASTAAGTLATSFENGDSIDGVTLATGDRILLKDQAAGAENGIYTVNASGAPTRATDADSAAELRGTLVPVEEGTANGDKIFQLTTDNITLGTTALTFIQLPGPQDILAGNGLTKTGNTINIIANANGTIVPNTDDLSVSVALVAVHTNIASAGSLGILAHTAADTITSRTITGTANRITLTGGDGSANPTIDISTSYVGQATITTLGTIGTGVWQGTVVGLAYGGTGIDASTGSGATTARDSTHLGRPATAPATATNVTVSATGILATAKFQITGTGAATSFTLTHNLNNLAPIVGPLIKTSTGAREWVTTVVSSANAVTITFNTAPANAVTYDITIAG